MSQESDGDLAFAPLPDFSCLPPQDARVRGLAEAACRHAASGGFDTALLVAWQAAEHLWAALLAEPRVRKVLDENHVDRLLGAGPADSRDALMEALLRVEVAGAVHPPGPAGPAADRWAGLPVQSFRVLAAYGRQVLSGPALGRQAAMHALRELERLAAWWAGFRDGQPRPAAAPPAVQVTAARVAPEPELDDLPWDERGHALRDRMLRRVAPFEDLWLEADVGEGTWSTTCLARRGGPRGPLVAVRIVRPASEVPGKSADAVTKGWREELDRQALVRRSDSPHVVRASCRDVRGFMRFDDLPDGDLLACVKAVPQAGGQPAHRIEQVVEWIHGVGQGAASLLACGAPVIDLHPRHIRIDATGAIRLLDLGRCRPQHWSAPEWKLAASEDDITPAATTYSLALIFLDLVLLPADHALCRAFRWDPAYDHYGSALRSPPLPTQVRGPDPQVLTPALKRRLDACPRRRGRSSDMAGRLKELLAQALAAPALERRNLFPQTFAAGLRACLEVT